jgi:hypothetical protein
LKWCLAAGLAAGAAVQFAMAQSSIIFSQPNNDTTPKPNASMPPPSHNVPNTYNAPSSVFGNKPEASFDVLPGASKPVPLTPEQARQWQKNLETQKNWMLMTPEEILGVQTPEEILGLSNPKNDRNLSAEERYLQREHRGQSLTVTNGMAGPAGLAGDADNPFQPHRADDRSTAPGDGTADATGLHPQRLFGQPLNADGNTPFNANQNQRADSPWASAFNAPAQSEKEKLDYAAAMEHFRASLNPPPPTENPATPTVASTPAASAPDPNLQVLPHFNPAGNSFTPLQSSASKPEGIMPLPGITGYPKKPAPPKPAVQPPPWLSTQPQPGAMPQRVF